MQCLLVLTFILAPTYVIRFKLLGLPTNLLMVWVFLFWLIFALRLTAKKQLSVFLTAVKNTDKKTLLLISLFFLSGVISLLVGGIDRQKLGQFIVLFLQPIITFFIANFIFKQYPSTKNFLLSTLYFLLGIAGLYAILQYFILLGLPAAWWGNSVEPKRALSFFVHPNFYALWCAPLLAFLIPDIFASLKTNNYKLKTFAWLLGVLGLLLSLSRSGWLGLGAAVLVYLIIAADKKTRKIILAGAVIVVAIVVYYPNLRYRFITPFYGEKSANSRIELWGDGLKAIKKSPILGLGLTGFATQYGALNTDPTLDTHNFPHNIFLNFWVETGLIGLISFMGLIGLLIYRGLKNRKDAYQLAVALFLIALIFQGLVDNPYFKNDLALVFWIILSLTII
jgi:O-antigen ligase